MRAAPQLTRRGAMTAGATWGLGMRPAAADGRVRQAEALTAAGFVDAAGRPRRLQELTRPLLLVNLWAWWCPGCVAELPALRSLANRIGPDAIDIVLLSHAMNWAKDLAYGRRVGLDFAQWRLAPQTAEPAVEAVFRIEQDRFGLPQTLVFAGRGRTLVHYHEGSQDWAAAEQLRQAQAWLRAAG